LFERQPPTQKLEMKKLQNLRIVSPINSEDTLIQVSEYPQSYHYY
ncbi:MAG: hypothetical protein EZS28_039496, partial [Streblomastix strix]